MPAAKGSWRYYANDELQAVEESWEYSQGNNGVDSYSSERRAGGICIGADSEWVNGRCRSMQLSWRSEGVIPITAEYRDGLCRYQNGKGEPVEIQLPATRHWYPLMRIHTGAVIKAIAADNGSAEVLVPDIRDPGAPATLLRPLCSERRVVFKADEIVLIDGKSISAERWTFIGGNYGPDAGFWLDEAGDLLRYVWQQSADLQWRVERVEQTD